MPPRPVAVPRHPSRAARKTRGPWRLPLFLGLGLAVTACGGGRQPLQGDPTIAGFAALEGRTLAEMAPAAPRVPPPPAPRPSVRSVAFAGPPGLAPPRIVTPSAPLQCVPYARRLSGIQIHGDAWTWWRGAAGRYRKTRAPAVGAVLVLERKGDSLGHLAVVTRILDDREIVVSHANWLNQGRIHKGTPVKDVSFWGNWTSVKVWYTPGNHYGGRTYAAYGFIHPKVTTAAR